MKNLCKYISLNFLSVIGYVFFFSILYVIFLWMPEFITKDYGEYGLYAFAYAIFDCIKYALIYGFYAFLGFIVEFLIYKIFKIKQPMEKVSDKLGKIYLILFYVGFWLFIALVIFVFCMLLSDFLFYIFD